MLGTSSNVFANYRDFKMTGAGTDDQWSTVANWEEGALPTSREIARIDKSGVIASGVSAEAAKLAVAGFVTDTPMTELTVNLGGRLSVGSSGIKLAYSRKNALLDVSGSLSSTGDLQMGGTSGKYTSTATVNFNSGSMVSLGGINVGLTPLGGTYAVTQSGGAVSLTGDLMIADGDDSLASGHYSISGGSLSAVGLNTGGNGTSTAKFSVSGSDANISFSSQSSLGGQTELEFILDATGGSALDMTAGGYTVASTASLTVDASAYLESTGDGILLIGTTNTPPAFNVANVSVPLGYDLDYRPDGLYLIGASSSAAVSPLFHDNMVLQRDLDTPVWGCDAPGSNVTVKLDGVVVGTAVADGNGDWMTGIGSHAHDGGQAHVLTVEFGVGSIQFNEVVFGDVYLASGQSNMNMPMAWLPVSLGEHSYKEERAVADSFPLIRHVSVSSETSTSVLAEPPLQINWTKCSQASLGDFSAVGYFFAKNLYQETGVPIGLLFSAWGGKSIEQFTSPSGMEAVPELAGMLESQKAGKVPLLYGIYNAMIAPLMPYGIKGAIWYQGENNGNDGDIYKYKMQALVRGWRKNWGQGDFPFYYVQLTNYNTSADWPGLRNAQTAALSEPNVGMAVTIDVGDYTDIHPRNKYDVGLRLARWALAKDYGKNIVYSSPLYRSTVVEGSQMRVLFDYADSGLFVGEKTGTDVPVETGDALQNFEIAGADKVFVAADAVIDRDSVLVSAASVSRPMYVRYCWASFPSGSNMLYNVAGLPASSFNSAE
jgi:sialate O-acetylesterase